MIDLKNGDCLELMKDIPTGSVDLILADLPYGCTACSWDSVIPIDELWKEWNRIIKRNGVVCVFGREPFSSIVRTSNIKAYKYDWIWKKTRGAGYLSCKYQPLKNYENIMVFYRTGANGGVKYYPQMRKGDPYIRDRRFNKKKGYHEIYDLTNEITVNETGDRFPLQVLEVPYDNEAYHPTQKPVALLEYLIKTYTNEGETVLDPVMGSGSTGVACINTGRNFIGIEKDEHYFQVAKERIEA